MNFGQSSELKMALADLSENLERSQTSNGVEYTCKTMNRGKCDGTYECHFNKDFINDDLYQFKTKEFCLADRLWQVQIKKENGRLGFYLVSRNEEMVDVNYNLQLVNFKSSSLSILTASRRTLSKDESVGISALAKLAVLRDPSSGFCNGGCLTLRLCLRLNNHSNERSSLKASSTSSTFTWSIKHLSDVAPCTRLCSSQFIAFNHTWTLSLCPSGKNEKSKNIGIYLVLKDPPCNVRARFSIKNHKPGKSDHFIIADHDYRLARALGVDQFIPIHAIRNPNNGLLNRGWVTFTVQIDWQGSDEVGSSLYDKHDVAHEVGDATEEESNCVICLTRNATCGLVHEGLTHKCLCSGCLGAYIRSSGRDRAKCPICRRTVEKVVCT